MHFCLDCNNNYDNNIAQSEHINANQIKCKQKEQFWNVPRFLVNGSTYILFQLFNIRQYSDFILSLWKYDMNQINNLWGSILKSNISTNEFFGLKRYSKRIHSNTMQYFKIISNLISIWRYLLLRYTQKEY